MSMAGVDGTPGGWAVVISRQEHLSIYKVGSLKDLIDREPSLQIIAVDVPIGLLDQYQTGGRECDRAARKFLGPGRASSVFPPPVRPVLAATSWTDACERSRNSGPNGRAISKQCFGILPKIKEVDDLLQAHPSVRSIIREVHPEVSFFELLGRKTKHAKSKLLGRDERRSALRTAFPDFAETEDAGRKLRIPIEDILDAAVACWSAIRLAESEGRSLPQVPRRDATGLPMAIWV